MSNTDSFIDEVSQEVRRDRLYTGLRKYGWIGVLLVILIVGGASWREYQKVQSRDSARAFGDAITAALEAGDAEARIVALEQIEAPQPGARAVLAMLLAAEQGNADADAAAVQTLQQVATNGDVPLIYRQIASLKALSRPDGGLDAQQRRAGLEELASDGAPLRLLAEEQLALLDIAAGERDAALERLQAIRADGEASQGLRRRATQLIVSLGGTPDAA